MTDVKLLLTLVVIRPIAIFTMLTLLPGSYSLPRYFTFQDLLEFTGRDILDIGVKNGAHRTRLISSLAILKEKYNKGQFKFN